MKHCVRNVLFLVATRSTVECRTLNRESPGSIPPFASVSKFGHFYSLHSDTCVNEFLAIDSDGNVSELSSRVECFPEKLRWCGNE